jgi:membrane protease YdiL (CAAX protease family)
MDENAGSGGERPGSDSENPQAPLRLPSIGAALLTLSCTLAFLLLLAWLNSLDFLMPRMGQMPGRFTGALAIELISLGLPLAVLFLGGRYNFTAGLGLYPAPVSALAGGVLAGAGLVSVAPQLEAWLARIFPPPPGYMEGLNEILRATDIGSFVMALLALGVAPAFLEEAMFRGVLLGALLRRCRCSVSVLLTGLLFGLFHLDPHRWPVLALTGVLISWTAAVGGSLWPAIAMHLTNNTLAIILVNCRAVEGQAWVDEVGDVPLTWLSAGMVLIAAGSLLVWVSARRGCKRDDQIFRSG